MLTARTAERPYVEAADAARGEAFLCRGCGAPVVLKAGRIRTPHFAHRPDAACAFGAAMSLAHLICQQTLAHALRVRGVTAELEAWLPGLAGDRRIDLLAHPAGRPDRRIAIEAQQADLTVQAIAARTASYQAQGVAPLWLRLIDFARLSGVRALPRRGGVWVERYPARAWERWAHDGLAGHLWFWDTGAERLWRGRFLPAFSRRGHGGLARPVTSWVGLVLDGPFRPEALRLQRGDQGLAAWFVPPLELPDARGGLATTDRLAPGGVESFLGGRWIAETPLAAPADWRTAEPLQRPSVTAPNPQRLEP